MHNILRSIVSDSPSNDMLIFLDMLQASLTFEPNLPCPYVLPVLVTGAVGTLSCDAGKFTLKVTLGRLDLAILAVDSSAHPGAVALAAGKAVTW